MNRRHAATVSELLGVLLALAVPGAVFAQDVRGIQPGARPGEEQRSLMEEFAPAKPPPLEVEPAPVPEAPPAEARGGRVYVREIRVTGVTVFPAEAIQEIKAPYEGRELTSEDLEALRTALTLLYVKRGYVNSGAVIPDQTVVDATVQIHVIEGELSRIDIEGNRWFRDGYLRRRVELGADPPLNVVALQHRLQILQQDNRIEQIRAELKPGLQPGESVLDVQVEEAVPYELTFTFDNYQAPSVGAERGRLTAAHHNLTGNGDILSFTYGRSDGVNPLIDAWYSIPFTVWDTSLTLRYEKNDYLVVEEPFDPLNVESESDIYRVVLRQPLYRSVANEVALSVIGEHSRNQTSLSGDSFSLYPGAEDGDAKVTALRFMPEWVYRSRSRVVAAISRFSVGIKALDATENNEADMPDSQFFAWLGQFQWAEVWHRSGLHSILRTDIQLSADPLLPLEQIAVGGRYSVRGYRENQIVRDNAAIASLEVRYPLFRDEPWADYLEIGPFLDWGHGWNDDQPSPSPHTLWSAGLGLRWGATLLSPPFQVRPRFEFYWGHPFRDVDTEGGDDDLQDDGIHLQFAISIP